MNRPVGIGRLSALLAVVVALGAIVCAVLLAPEFSWAGDALSDLGVPSSRTAGLFNGGLALAGALGLPFAASLAATARTRLDWLTSLVLLATLLSLAGVGCFPSGHPYHLPAAAGFYLGATLTLWVDGTAGVLADEPRFGLAAIWLGNLQFLQWLAWGAGLRVGPGLAIPETVGATLFAVWVLARVE